MTGRPQVPRSVSRRAWNEMRPIQNGLHYSFRATGYWGVNGRDMVQTELEPSTAAETGESGRARAVTKVRDVKDRVPRDGTDRIATPTHGTMSHWPMDDRLQVSYRSYFDPLGVE